MENRTPEEEMEYRRYLRRRIRMRKRKRKVRIIKALLALAAIVIAFFVFYLIGWLTGPIGGSKEGSKATQTPKSTVMQVDVPKGYESVYKKLVALEGEYSEISDILLNLDSYPKNLLELLAKNQETVSFVSDYLMHVDDETASGSITEEELKEDVPLFQQWDKRWGYVHYGNDIIAIDGCGPTCMSMVYTGITQKTDKTPADIAEFCMNHDYYTQDTGTAWALMSSGAQKLGLSVSRVSLSESAVREALKNKKPVICSMGAGDFTDNGHFIVLKGISKDGKLQVNDPNSIARSEKEWDFEVVLKQAKAAWAYGK